MREHQGTTTLQATLNLSKKSNSAGIQLITWNDFGEGTMLEPTREFAYSFLETIQRYAGVSYTKTELELVHKWYTLRKKYPSDKLIQAALLQAYYFFVSLDVAEAKSIIEPLNKKAYSCRQVKLIFITLVQAFTFAGRFSPIMSKPRQVETKKKIAFSDCDPFRHLNNARYLDYFLDTREEQVEEAYGISLIEWSARGKAWLVRQNQIAYLRPANYREEVTLISRLINFSGTLLQVEMLMMDSAKSHLKAFLWTTLTHISVPEGRKQEHPPEFMQLLQEIVYQEEGMETAIFEKRLQQIKAMRP